MVARTNGTFNCTETINVPDRTSGFYLIAKTTPVPRCHDKEVIMLNHEGKNMHGEFDNTILEIHPSGSSVKLLRKQDRDDVMYYSDESGKIDRLKALKASYLDRFCEEAPTPDCFEVKVAAKIDELIKLINLQNVRF